MFGCIEKAAWATLARADKGLDTVIGEGGVKVSDGEKQRLEIAEPYYVNPHLLILTKLLPALDSLTEEEISGNNSWSDIGT